MKRVAVCKIWVAFHRAFRGLVLVLLMSLMGTFPESAPPWVILVPGLIEIIAQSDQGTAKHFL